MSKKVVIVGKPNVGKSQLFNRLVGEKHSIVLSEPGITRDRITLEVNWLGKKFLLTDTGGYTTEKLSFQDEINKQVKIAVFESELILFVVSAKDGIDNDDIFLSKILKKNKISENKVFVVANKCDCRNIEFFEINKLGFGEAIFVSAEHGINTGKLLEKISTKLDLDNQKILDFNKKERLKLAIIGRPNVGKSSLVNAILKEDRVITSEIAGTTRDVVDLDFSFMGTEYTILDTPGIRKHASIYKDEKEKYSVLRAKKAISRANIILFVLDISEELTELDERIGGLIYKANIPVLVIANKWDLIKFKTDKTRRDLEKNINNKFKFLKWAPILFISVKEKHNIFSIFYKLDLIFKEIKKDINPSTLRDFIKRISFLFTVPEVKGKKILLFSVEKIKGQVPTFLILCNNPDFLHFSYARLLENQIRKCFDYKLTPITVIYKKK